MSYLQGRKQIQKLALWRFLLFRVTIFTGILVASVYLFIKSSITDQEIEFNSKSSDALNRIQEQLIINDAALSGFASLLQTLGAADIDRVEEYAAGMAEAYGQIYMFEALLGISPEDQQAFSESMQERGLQNYQVYRYTSNDNDNPPESFSVFNDTPVMFPVFFISPLIEQVRSILGFDMMSIKSMREPLIRALTTGQTEASLPFNLKEGGKGYILYKSINKPVKSSGSDALGTLIATMLVRADLILDAAHQIIPRANITMLYDEKKELTVDRKDTPQSDTVPVWQLGELTQEYSLDQFGHKLDIQIMQPAGLYQSQLNQLMIMVLLLILGFLVFLRTSIAKRGSELQRDNALIDLARQHDLLEQMVLERTADLQATSDENKRLARLIVRLEETTYQRLARELHDEFGQMLTAIKISAHIMSQTESNETVIKSASEIFQHSDQLYEKSQNLIQRLRPEALDTFGLKVAIEQCANRFKFTEQGVDVELDIDDAVDNMDEIFIIASYRITQELLNNAAKYAQATKITVHLNQQLSGIYICVMDNGVGFDPDSLEKGYGLNGIAERVRSLGGKINTNAAVGKGVKTCAELPSRFLAINN